MTKKKLLSIWNFVQLIKYRVVITFGNGRSNRGVRTAVQKGPRSGVICMFHLSYKKSKLQNLFQQYILIFTKRCTIVFLPIEFFTLKITVELVMGKLLWNKSQNLGCFQDISRLIFSTQDLAGWYLVQSSLSPFDICSCLQGLSSVRWII